MDRTKGTFDRISQLLLMLCFFINCGLSQDAFGTFQTGAVTKGWF